MGATVDLMPFIVRLQDGREWRGYARGVAHAANRAEPSLSHDDPENVAVLVIRADEPFTRHPTRLARLLRRWL